MPSFIQPPLEDLPLGLPGQISRLGSFVTTRTLNQAAGLAQGLLVAPSGTTGQECASPVTSAHVASAVGFSCYRAMSVDFDATHHYEDNEAVAILESGHMYVLAEGDCVADAPVYARITADGLDTVLGKVRGDGDGGTAIIVPGTFFDASRTGAGLVEIRRIKIN
jgi:hypothetical protein